MTSQALPYLDFCAIEGCGSRDYPLHFVHYGNRFTRLCTHCVLKTNPGIFCAHCFFLMCGDPPPTRVRCSRCRMVAHLGCLQNPNDSSQYLCPACRSTDSSSFRWFSHERGTLVDAVSLRSLHTATSLVHSLNKQAVGKMTKIAEEKTMAAVESKLHADRLVEVSMELYKEIKEKKKKATAVVNAERVVPKNKVINREFDKWSRYHEMTDDMAHLVSRSKKVSVSSASSQMKQNLPSSGLAQSMVKVFGPDGMNNKETSNSVNTRDVMISRTNSTNSTPTIPRLVTSADATK